MYNERRTLKPTVDGRRRRPLNATPTAAITAVAAAVLTALYGAKVYAAAPAAPGSSPSSDDSNSLQEVVVTASRRAVSAQDLPISITAVSGDALDKAHIEDIAGLANSMAGINYVDRGPFGGVNGSNLIIRGLNSESLAFQEGLATQVVPPVATYIDDTPLYFNIRLDDLDRVEVLRGPQGTLYGSGSLGGTIKFVLNAPDPSAFDAKGEIGASKTQHAENMNEEVKGMINLPLSDVFAIRLNASASGDAGFVNQTNLYVLNAQGVPVLSQPTTASNPVGLGIAPETYSKDGVNSYRYRDGRISALYKPSDEFKVQLSYFFQRSTATGFPYISQSALAYTQPIAAANQYLPYGQIPPVPTNPSVVANPPDLLTLFPGKVPAGTDRLSNATTSLEGTEDEVNVFALNVDYDFGFATLTSSSSFGHHNNTTNDDLTAEYENFAFYQSLYGQNPRTLLQAHDQDDDKVASQEFRLASKTGKYVDWIGGLFYKYEKQYIQEHEYYPGYNDFFNACTGSGLYAPSDLGGVNASACGAGEFPPGNIIDGINNPTDQAYIGDVETTFRDIAILGEATGHITSAWNVTVGARLFKQTVSQAQQTGLLFDGCATPELCYVSGNSGFDEWRRALWKLNTSYQLDKTNLVYATWSQGFRRGGINALPGQQPVPAVNATTTCPAGSPNAGNYCLSPSLLELQPDKVDNYEVGIKGVFENRLNYSFDIYDMQWHNLQEGTSLTPLSLPAAANVGNAYSRGLELDLMASITHHVAAKLGYTYDQTKLTSFDFIFSQNVTAPLPPPGGPLPGTPRNSVEGGLEFGHFNLAGGELLYGIDARYHSRIVSSISETAPIVPPFHMLDTRLTYTKSHVLATLYVNNLTNTLGINAITDPLFWGNRTSAVISEPRTIGLTLGYSFKGY